MVRGPREPNPPTLGAFYGIPKADVLPLQKVITNSRNVPLFQPTVSTTLQINSAGMLK